MLGGYYENACFNRNKELSSSSFIFFCTISHLHTPECYYYHQHPHIPFGEDTGLLAALRDNATSHRRDVDATRAPLFFFPPTDLCTDATAQQTAGAQPYQQAKEVPLLQTKAWQLTVMHRLDFSDNFLFAPPPPPFAILPHTWPTRDASWGEYKSLLTHWKCVRGIFVVRLSCMSNCCWVCLSVRSLGQ